MTDHTKDNSATPAKRSGFIGVLGLTNVGKSTLINALVGAKVAITSHKVQTTRQRLLGLTVHQNSQLIFMDTPGFFEPKRRLDRAMVHSALSAPRECDLTLLLVDPFEKTFDKHIDFLKRIPASNHSQILVINKIDLVPREQLLATIQRFQDIIPTDATFLVSALKENGLVQLKDHLAKAMPEGEYLYPKDQLSNLPDRELASEITREKIYQYLHQELPYAIYVETEEFKTIAKKEIKISQAIHVMRPSHKGIVLGEKGQKIQQIGKAARLEMCAFLGCTVHLKLHVKVSENWTEDPSVFQALHLEFNA